MTKNNWKRERLEYPISSFYEFVFEGVDKRNFLKEINCVDFKITEKSWIIVSTPITVVIIKNIYDFFYEFDYEKENGSEQSIYSDILQMHERLYNKGEMIGNYIRISFSKYIENQYIFKFVFIDKNTFDFFPKIKEHLLGNKEISKITKKLDDLCFLFRR